MNAQGRVSTMMNWPGGSTVAAEKGEVISVNVASRDGLLADLSALMRARKGFSVATLNLDHVVKLRRDPVFRDAYRRQSHVTADGNPIVWLESLARHPVALIPGSELIEPVLQQAAATQTRVAFFGSTEAALRAARDKLVSRYPDLEVVATLAPPMGFEPKGEAAEAYIAQIKASGAGLCLLALGAPKQEIFASVAHARLPDVGFLSIGAGLDFIAGRQTRAPLILRKLALEWLWRMMRNPGRLARRYLRCFAILPSLIAQALKTRWRAM